MTSHPWVIQINRVNKTKAKPYVRVETDEQCQKE